MSKRSAYRRPGFPQSPKFAPKPSNTPLVFVLGSIFAGGVAAGVLLHQGAAGSHPMCVYDPPGKVLYAGRRNAVGEPLCWN